MGVSKNSGTHKMDEKIMVPNPMNKWDDLGFFPIIFGLTPTWRYDPQNLIFQVAGKAMGLSGSDAAKTPKAAICLQEVERFIQSTEGHVDFCPYVPGSKLVVLGMGDLQPLIGNPYNGAL